MLQLVLLILVGCLQQQASSSRRSLTIGVIYEDSTEYSTLIPELTSVFSNSEAEFGINVTVSARSWSPSQRGLACQLVDASTIVLATLGSCKFQNTFIEAFFGLNLPVPLLQVDVDGQCGNPTGQEYVFSTSISHQWLPFAVQDIAEAFRPSQVILLYSQAFSGLASRVGAAFSKAFMPTLVMAAEDMLGKTAMPTGLLTSDDMSNSSATVVALLSRMDEDVRKLFTLKISYFVFFVENAIFNASMFSSWDIARAFFLAPGELPGTANFTWTNGLSTLPENANLAVRILKSVLLVVSQDTAMDNSTVQCEQYNTTVAGEATHIKNILAESFFEKDGHTKIRGYDIKKICDTDCGEEGTWSAETGLKDLDLSIDTLKSVNYTIRVGTTAASPFVMLRNGAWEGFCIDMLNELAVRVGFKYTIVQSKDGLWGAVNPDGSWNGVIGMAMNDEIDLAIGPVSVTADRETVVDFTMPYMESAAGMLMQRFEDNTAKMFRTLMPFTFNLWMALAGLLAAVGILFGIINRFSPSGQVSREENPNNYWITNMWDSAWVVYGSFMEQGAEMHPHGMPGRVVLGLWWVFTILTSASYTANLAAFLTVNMDAIPISSIEALAQQSQIKPLVKNGSNLYALFQKGETPIYRRLWQMMQDAPAVQSNAEAMAVMMSGPYAFLTDREQLGFLRKASCQSLVQSKESFNNNGLSFSVRKGWPLLEKLSYNMIKMMEAGLLDKWRRKWWSTTDMCPDDQEGLVSPVNSLELDSTAGPFILYAASTCLAVLVLLCERALHVLWPAVKAMMARRSVEV